MPYQRISVEEAESLIEKNEVTLIDIRDKMSFDTGNVKASIHVTNENVEDVLSSADKNKPLIIYCYHGNSSQGAADYFYNMGFKQSFSVDGGFEEWKLKLINASI
tara:strand:- start:13578 stop:13892 length:315 start_codon:yes stop_codon:yes gene_type:complete